MWRYGSVLFSTIYTKTIVFLLQYNILQVIKGNMTIHVLPLLSFKASGYIQMSNKSEENLYLSGNLQYDGVMSRLNGVFQVNQNWVNAFGVKYLTLANIRARYHTLTHLIHSSFSPPLHYFFFFYLFFFLRSCRHFLFFSVFFLHLSLSVDLLMFFSFSFFLNN